LTALRERKAGDEKTKKRYLDHVYGKNRVPYKKFPQGTSLLKRFFSVVKKICQFFRGKAELEK